MPCFANGTDKRATNETEKPRGFYQCTINVQHIQEICHALPMALTKGPLIEQKNNGGFYQCTINVQHIQKTTRDLVL